MHEIILAVLSFLLLLNLAKPKDASQKPNDTLEKHEQKVRSVPGSDEWYRRKKEPLDRQFQKAICETRKKSDKLFGKSNDEDCKKYEEEP